MKLDQLTKGLTQAFVQEKHRIVFWYDAEQSFTDSLAEINKVIGDIKILNMQGQSALGTKILLEREDTQNKYLLYFPYAEPDPEQDWLLDIKLYSQTFYADRFSILLNEFGLEQPTLREHLTKRATYLASKERINNLKRYLKPNFDENQIDMAMIASVLRADSNDINDIIIALANKLASQEAGLMQNPNEIAELKKYGLIPSLVSHIEQWLDIRSSLALSEDEQDIDFDTGKLFIRLLITELFNNLKEQPWASAHILQSTVAGATSRSFLTRWRDSNRYAQSYTTIAKWVSDSLKIDEKLRQLTLSQLLVVDTFEIIEKLIIIDIVEQIPTATDNQLQELKQAIDKRLTKFWVSTSIADKNQYASTYQALIAAIGLFSLRQKYNNGFNFDSLVDFYHAYENEIYQFDLHYRHYCEQQKSSISIIEPLNAEIEKCYSYWYLDNLAQSWDNKIEQENRLESWHLDNVVNQYNFYQHWVAPLTGLTQTRRTAVIISDALRYEAGVEICERINQKRYSEASITSQLGVLPSYTALGKASLLPHETLTYSSNDDPAKSDVFVDNISSQGTDNRNRILAKYTQNKGCAFTAEEVMGFNKQEGRDAFKPYEVIYIYHDRIDSIGDKQATENATFEAVATTIEELAELSQKIVRDFNTSTVFITSDHGFLFQQREMQETERKRLDDGLREYPIIKNKKRYVIAHNLPKNDGVWHGRTDLTANTTSKTNFWLPRGNQRFHFVGGARFSHGGAMPQEIVVPVITVSGLRGEKAQDRTKRPVQFVQLQSNLKIVDFVQSIEFLQTETVSELIVPTTVSVAIYDGNSKISSEEVIVFDSSSTDFNELKKFVRIALSGTSFDRRKDYYLIVKDKASEVELQRNKVIIDIGFIE